MLPPHTKQDNTLDTSSHHTTLHIYITEHPSPQNVLPSDSSPDAGLEKSVAGDDDPQPFTG